MVALSCNPVVWEVEARGFRVILDYMRPHDKNNKKITVLVAVLLS